MLSMTMHLRSRLPVIVMYSTVLLAAPAAVRAAPPDVPPDIRPPSTDSPAPATFSEIVQAGAKMFGKNSQSENPNRALPDVNAKGTSSTMARKAAIAELPIEHLN